MPVRYVFKDGTQVGILYVTKRGVHLIGGGNLVNFFKLRGAVKDNELIVHPVDDEGDQFIEFAGPIDNKSEAETIVEKELNDHGYVLSPRRF